MKSSGSCSRLVLVLAVGALVAGSWAVFTPGATAAGAAAAALPCTTVSKTGVCKIRYGGITYCSTIGGTGTETCPTGTHHVGASDSPQPCLPVGGPCERTIRCCLNETEEP